MVYIAENDLAAVGARINRSIHKGMKSPNPVAPAVKKHKFKDSVKNQKNLPLFTIYNEMGPLLVNENMSTGGLMQGRKRKQSSTVRQGKIKQIVAEKSEKLHH